MSCLHQKWMLILLSNNQSQTLKKISSFFARFLWHHFSGKLNKRHLRQRASHNLQLGTNHWHLVETIKTLKYILEVILSSCWRIYLWYSLETSYREVPLTENPSKPIKNYQMKFSRMFPTPWRITKKIPIHSG